MVDQSLRSATSGKALVETPSGRILRNQERVVLDLVSKFERVRSSGHFW